MTVYRTFDPTLHNWIANIPSVRETFALHLPDDYHFDYTSWTERPDDYILLTDGIAAATLLDIKTPVVYDCHTLFAPGRLVDGEWVGGCRGKDAIRICREMIDWVFEYTACQIMVGATPIELKAARRFNRLVGFKSAGIHTLTGVHWTHQMEHTYRLRSDWEADRQVQP